MKENTCCFIGHKKINFNNEQKQNLYDTIEKLIIEEKVNTFLFGSNSQFNDVCHLITSKLKEIYPHIKRIYVRAEFPHIDNSYKLYLLQNYEDTYYPNNIINAGKAAYVERNFEMINRSKYCIIYFNKNYLPHKRKKSNKDLCDYQPNSGTKIAYNYAIKKHTTIINVFNETT